MISVVGIAVIALLNAPSVKAADKSAPLEVNATLGRSRFTVNEDIVVRLRLKNVGQVPLFLKPPDSMGPGDGRTTIHFLIARDGKTINSYSRQLTGGLSGGAPDPITLKAGECSAFFAFTLGDNTSFFEKLRYDYGRNLGSRLPPGSYTMKVRYSFTAEQANLNHETEWIGDAVSSPLNFIINGTTNVFSGSDSWSAASGGLRGRLIVEKGAELNGSRLLDVYMELKNVTASELTLFYDDEKPMLVCDLRDSGDRIVHSAVDVTKNSLSTGRTAWSLPPGKIVRLKVSVNAIGIPKDIVDIQMPCGHWTLQRTDKRRYFLDASLIKRSQFISDDKRVWWYGGLDFPKVLIPE